MLLYRKEANLLTLRSRYRSMYIPSDFFHAALLWSDAFPVHRPLRLGQACQFHIMSKEIEATNRKQLETLLDPHDADHTFNAKVLILLDCEVTVFILLDYGTFRYIYFLVLARPCSPGQTAFERV